MFYTLKEAALAHNTSYDSLRGFLSKALTAAHNVTDRWVEGPWIMDIFPSYVVYQYQSMMWKRGYTVAYGAAGTEPVITLKDNPIKVHTAYMDNKDQAAESMRVFLDLPALKESVTVTPEVADKQVRESVSFEMTTAIKEGKGPTTIPIKIIAPGWGSMAYYSKEVLQRDGPIIFKSGTPMMWNHATESEEIDRPEGDLSNLAAILTKNAEWQDNGVKGPGLYSEAKVFSDYSTQVAEKGPYIGVSINAGIKCHEGEAEGKTGKIADKFIYAFSTDFVTKAGAGGAPIVPVIESQRVPIMEDNAMTDAEIKALEAKNRDLEKQLKESQDREAINQASLNRASAVDAVSAVLKEGGIPYKMGILARACANPTMKEGKPDPEWVKGVVSDFSEGITGKVTGNGATETTTEADTDKKIQESLKKSLTELGVPEAGMEAAMGGR